MIIQLGENAPSIEALMELDWFREAVMRHAESVGYEFARGGVVDGCDSSTHHGGHS